MADGPQVDAPPKDMMGFLEYYLVTKAPFQLPDNAKEFIVQWGPWITIVMLVLLLPPLLFVLGIGTVFLPVAGLGYGYLLLGVVIEIVLIVLALPGLFARKMSGWTMLFYARLVGAVTNLLAGAVVGAILGLIISLYILFQVRPLYKS